MDNTDVMEARKLDALRQAEAALQESNALLQERTAELDAFNYTISHDLRSQLMVINSFSTILQEDYQATLDADGKQYLTRITEATNRIAELINDLLNLSRTTRSDIRKVDIDLSGLVQAISGELKEGAPERSAQFTIAENVRIHGDPGLMRIAVESLMRNAWKFTSKQTHAVIEFCAESNNGRTHCFFRDNGVGFDMAKAEKLFSPFCRLHAKKEFPGNGIGLATVARIIRRHGGKTWAQGKVGEGATIHFDMPDTVGAEGGRP